eukprot:CAMPEP_0180480128 /NCGR_PEP_ID=MMETSP1036_2-20121128/33665_1 /TAXON_ID=632150 /ORGANISM="Azadinium spinosum, Strain 3D9" /LENGTH=64 /DNA_ID=CAMNT_0022487731 /DNA_START=138 /DNA_END=332 /DNA_ORIENTATION=-
MGALKMQAIANADWAHERLSSSCLWHISGVLSGQSFSHWSSFGHQDGCSAGWAKSQSCSFVRVL